MTDTIAMVLVERAGKILRMQITKISAVTILMSSERSSMMSLIMKSLTLALSQNELQMSLYNDEDFHSVGSICNRYAMIN